MIPRSRWPVEPDFAQSRSPSSSRILNVSPRVVFLAAPISAELTSSGRLRPRFRQFIERLIVFLRSNGWDVRSAHESEGWGAKRAPPPTGFVKDLEGIGNASLVIAYLGGKVARGVLIEVGYAYALGKPTLILQRRGARVPYMVRGLVANDGGRLVLFESRDDLFKKLANLLSRSPNIVKKRQPLDREKIR